MARGNVKWFSMDYIVQYVCKKSWLSLCMQIKPCIAYSNITREFLGRQGYPPSIRPCSHIYIYIFIFIFFSLFYSIQNHTFSYLFIYIYIYIYNFKERLIHIYSWIQSNTMVEKIKQKDLSEMELKSHFLTSFVTF